MSRKQFELLLRFISLIASVIVNCILDCTNTKTNGENQYQKRLDDIWYETVTSRDIDNDED